MVLLIYWVSFSTAASTTNIYNISSSKISVEDEHVRERKNDNTELLCPNFKKMAQHVWDNMLSSGTTCSCYIAVAHIYTCV